MTMKRSNHISMTVGVDTCEDCVHAKPQYQQWNLDRTGRPLTIRCQHYEDGRIGLNRSQRACELFENKSKKL